MAANDTLYRAIVLVSGLQVTLSLSLSISYQNAGAFSNRTRLISPLSTRRDRAEVVYTECPMKLYVCVLESKNMYYLPKVYCLILIFKKNALHIQWNLCTRLTICQWFRLSDWLRVMKTIKNLCFLMCGFKNN